MYCIHVVFLDSVSLFMILLLWLPHTGISCRYGIQLHSSIGETSEWWSSFSCRDDCAMHVCLCILFIYGLRGCLRLSGV